MVIGAAAIGLVAWDAAVAFNASSARLVSSPAAEGEVGERTDEGDEGGRRPQLLGSPDLIAGPVPQVQQGSQRQQHLDHVGH